MANYGASHRSMALCPNPFPVRALLARVENAADDCSWREYLPPRVPHGKGLRTDLFEVSPFVNQDPNEAPGSAVGDVAGHVWNLSRDPLGCRRVQCALEEASPEEGERLAAELRGHIGEALRCPHANHVVQKCVLTVRGRAVQFIVDELMEKSLLLHAARHKYGCRIIQRLVERLNAVQVHRLVEGILADASAICRHPYGNYVMQNLLEHATTELRRRILKFMHKDLRALGSDSYGCAVISAALLRCEPAERAALAVDLAKEPGLLVFMACHRHGNVAATRVLQVLQGEKRETVRQRLAAEAGALYASKFGRLVLDFLDGRTGEGALLAAGF